MSGVTRSPAWRISDTPARTAGSAGSINAWLSETTPSRMAAVFSADNSIDELFRHDDRVGSLDDREAVSGGELPRDAAPRGVGPADRDVGLAGGAEAEVERVIVLRAVVAEAAAELLRLRDAAGRDRDPRPDRA